MRPLPINPSILAQFPGRAPHLYQVNFTVPWWWNFMIHCLTFLLKFTAISKSSISFLIAQFFYYISLTQVCEIFRWSDRVVTCLSRSPTCFLFCLRLVQTQSMCRCRFSQSARYSQTDDGCWQRWFEEKTLVMEQLFFYVCPYDVHSFIVADREFEKEEKLINKFQQRVMKCRQFLLGSSRINIG
jgi:hypothetical protein